MIVFECQECGHEKGEPTALVRFTDRYSEYCPNCDTRREFRQKDDQ